MSAPQLDPDILEAAASAAAWPFEEARKLVARLERCTLCASVRTCM